MVFDQFLGECQHRRITAMQQALCEKSSFTRHAVVRLLVYGCSVFLDACCPACIDCAAMEKVAPTEDDSEVAMRARPEAKTNRAP